MLTSTLSRLRCPGSRQDGTPCRSELSLSARSSIPIAASGLSEVLTGELLCRGCRARFPILNGVALLVEDVRGFLLSHVKGVAQVVRDEELPADIRDEFLEAKDEIQAEHIEEDLESSRVVSLYVMNHYLRVSPGRDSQGQVFWRSEAGEASPLIEELIRKHWDHGPFATIGSWIEREARARPLTQALELGCGAGGLSAVLRPSVGSYLGIDSSFASVAIARHLALGAPYAGRLLMPRDLLQGPVSAEMGLQPPPLAAADGKTDFVVGELENLPAAPGCWDVTLALNTIDMLADPAMLPRLQKELSAPGAVAIQSCPYVWHESVARDLREQLPAGIRDSHQAAEWLYAEAGFRIEESVDQLPWLFFKHLRQLEIYSVHLFQARN